MVEKLWKPDAIWFVFFDSVLWRELVVSLAKLLVSMIYDNWNISGNYHTKLDNHNFGVRKELNLGYN